MTDDSTKDRAPEGPDEWAAIWSGVQKAHDGWFVVKVFVAVFGNWRVIFTGFGIALVLAGPDLVQQILEVLK